MSIGVDPFAGPDIVLSEITVCDLEQADIERILNYWFGPSSEDLRTTLGIDPKKMPSRRLMREGLALKASQKSVPSTILIVRVRDIGIGMHELTHIEPNVSATMHAHIWNAEHRGRGIGAISYIRAMERFFAAHKLQRIMFDTPRKHLASNRLKHAWGILPASTGTFSISTMAEPIETARYQVERSDMAGIVDRVERNWKYRAQRVQE
ncbi:RimJ/RimL family protein N-acetyltransferase [Bradyrhizobium sp. USDA 4341]